MSKHFNLSPMKGGRPEKYEIEACQLEIPILIGRHKTILNN